VAGVRTDLVDDLNRLMAEEVEAFLRYFQMRFRIRGNGQDAAQKLFDDALKETLEHAEALGQRIRSLGHGPTLRVDLSLGHDAIRPGDALAEVLEIEQQALDAYKEFLPRAEHDPALAAFIRNQIEIETNHVEEIQQVIRAGAPIKLVDK
jgi:bacterioferritin (cytochrome b1)